MKTWADEAGITPPSTTIDRDAGQGPKPRCCDRRYVTADALVYFGDMDTDQRLRVRNRLTRLAHAHDLTLYLCDACRETLRRERVLERAEMPSSRPLRLPSAR